MNVYSEVPGYGRLASIPVLSKKARQRLKWFDYHRSRYLIELSEIFATLKTVTEGEILGIFFEQ